MIVETSRKQNNFMKKSGKNQDHLYQILEKKGNNVIIRAESFISSENIRRRCDWLKMFTTSLIV